MSVSSHIVQCFNGLAKSWGLECLKLNAQGNCSLQTNDGLPLVLDASQGDELLFYADIAPSLDAEGMAMQLLEANLSMGALRFAAFCVDANRKRLNLRYHYPIDAITEAKLGALLANFIEAARTARAQLASLTKPAAAPAPAHPATASRRILPMQAVVGAR